MRYCLKCRHLSGNGPLCTHCGRSFGGRLCNHKKGRHLNPPDANFCGQCGSTQLTEATSSLPLGWVSQMLLLFLLIGAGGVVVKGVAPALLGALSWPDGWSFQALTGYRSPAVWAIEKSAHILILLLVFYGLSALIPGEAGRQFRSVVTNFLNHLIRGVFKALGQLLSAVLKLLLSWLGRNGNKNKT